MKRRLQFRMRKLLIVVVALVVALGIILPAFKGAKEFGPRHPCAEPVADNK
jgi:hypothetical protein